MARDAAGKKLIKFLGHKNVGHDAGRPSPCFLRRMKMKTIAHNVGESNTRRGLKCTYCGHMIKPTRRERHAKTARQTCINCGHSSWEICKNSKLHIEHEIAEEAMSRARTDELGRKIL